jgi:hypothetical protein
MTAGGRAKSEHVPKRHDARETAGRIIAAAGAISSVLFVAWCLM